MQFEGFEIHAYPSISHAYCKECRNDLTPVSNGWFSTVLFCKKCKIIYKITLVKVPNKKISPEFLEQCEREVSNG